MTTRPFDGFFQLAYVTNEFDRAITAAGERYGVTGFDTFDTTLRHDDGGHTDIRVGLAWVGPLQVEIIEPRGGRDGLYRDALPDDGAFALRWHHVGFFVEDAEQLARVRAELVADGHPVALSGVRPGHARLLYVDARDRLGHHLEYVLLDPQA